MADRFAIDRAVADEAGTERLASDLAAILQPGDVIALHGDLGMGKSAFARALIRARAGDPALEVPSPTFTLVQSYMATGLEIHHFDLYRLSDPDELREIGFDAATRQGAVLVEWPERAGGDLPADRLDVAISEGDEPTARLFRLSGPPSFRRRVEKTLAIRGLLDEAGLGTALRRPLAGDASARRYERAVAADGRAIVMDWPPRPPAPAADGGPGYHALALIQDDPLAFAGVGAMLRAHGFAAPALLASDLKLRILVLEDFGDHRLTDADGRPDPDAYRLAVEVLAAKDAERFTPTIVLPGLGSWTVPRFGARAMTTELALLPDWYLPFTTGRETDPALRDEFLALWAGLLPDLEAGEPGLAVRDAIAANLLVLEGEDPKRRIGFLDHQDAVFGPEAYDLMSLLTDVRVAVEPELSRELTAVYAARRRALPGRPFTADRFAAQFALASAQRNSKILGGFARLAMRDGKRDYLRHLPQARLRIADALRHPVLAPLRLWYDTHVLAS